MALEVEAIRRDDDSVWLLDGGVIIGTLHLRHAQPADPRDSRPCERRQYIVSGVDARNEPDEWQGTDTIRYVSISATGTEVVAQSELDQLASPRLRGLCPASTTMAVGVAPNGRGACPRCGRGVRVRVDGRWYQHRGEQ